MPLPPVDSTSNECEHHLALSASPPPLPEALKSPCPLLGLPTLLPAPACRDGVKPPLPWGYTLRSPGKSSSQPVKAHIAHVMCFLASVSQTGKLQNWSLAWHLERNLPEVSGCSCLSQGFPSREECGPWRTTTLPSLERGLEWPRGSRSIFCTCLCFGKSCTPPPFHPVCGKRWGDGLPVYSHAIFPPKPF